jgi:hypothetical protein
MRAISIVLIFLAACGGDDSSLADIGACYDRADADFSDCGDACVFNQQQCDDRCGDTTCVYQCGDTAQLCVDRCDSKYDTARSFCEM